MNDLSKIRIWKISEGSNGRGLSDEQKQKLLAENAVAVYGDTKAIGLSSISQGEAFEKEIKDGDFFYLCYGNSIILLGQFIGDIFPDADPDLPEGFLKRQYKTIYQLDGPFLYHNNAPRRWWTPNYNSTCIPVPPEQFNEFKEYILSYFPENSVKQIITKIEGI